MILIEEAWNAYPHCVTCLTNGYLLSTKFRVVVESMHLPDRGTTENALSLSPEELKLRDIRYVDIAAPVPPDKYIEKEDPTKVRARAPAHVAPAEARMSGRCHTAACMRRVLQRADARGPACSASCATSRHSLPRALTAHYACSLPPRRPQFRSEKTGRGLLAEGWHESHEPIMTAYKVVRCDFKYWGLQTRAEGSITNSQQSLMGLTHRQAFCLIDEWHGLTMADIRRIEEETQAELERLRVSAEARGNLRNKKPST